MNTIVFKDGSVLRAEMAFIPKNETHKVVVKGIQKDTHAPNTMAKYVADGVNHNETSNVNTFNVLAIGKDGEKPEPIIKTQPKSKSQTRDNDKGGYDDSDDLPF